MPVVAATGHRFRCAVLGKYGMLQASTSPAAASMAPRFTRDAPRVSIPVLFHMQWDDELFPRKGQCALFDALGTPEKSLIAFPGPHSTATPPAVQAWCEFVGRSLAG
ncbi:MAG: hypothetical protein FJZ47_23240 [Candidatus Tectomicrobia bacterium]|uniref:Uncharacterized protein n=1 Tax=Tectimicrobiota bacterium TaxID=2528274 RepID=A0A937W7N1_UNCTE|nr:hypothetical protein [Candidatus Tectomicrobia bacterium]